MAIIINNKTLANISNFTIISITITGYLIGIFFYFTIKQRPITANFLVTETWMGSFTRAQHLIMFLFIGYFIPNKFWLTMILGIGWEIIELIARQYLRDAWWGNYDDYIKDIIVNYIGFII